MKKALENNEVKPITKFVTVGDALKVADKLERMGNAKAWTEYARIVHYIEALAAIKILAKEVRKQNGN